MTKKNTVSIEEQYKLLDEIAHVRQRPGMYVGSIVPTTHEQWVVENNKMVKKELTYNPGLLKIFSEILDNSVDEHKRNPSKLTTIKVTIDKDTGELSVHDNGGIPVVVHKDTNEYVPTMIFSNLRAGSNFNDHEDQALVGTNGVGSTLTTILSTWFEIKTSDGINSFKQVISDGLRKRTEPVIKTSDKNFTHISFLPDYAYFGESVLTEGNYLKMVKRVYDCAGCNPNIRIYLNGSLINIKSFKDYIHTYVDDVTFEENKDWSVGISHAKDGFEHISFVNSVETYDGGTHVDYVVGPIVAELRAYIKKKTKQDIKPSDIKQQLMVFISANINRPKFNSQTKSFMISEPRDYKTDYKPSNVFIKKLLKSKVVAEIIEWAENKQKLEELAALRKKNKEVSKGSLKDIIKYEPANSKDRSKTMLFIAEGDAASKPMQSARDPQFHGIFPVKGKPVNVRSMKLTDLIDNTELEQLMRIIGLQFGVEPELEDLRYRHLVISTDADMDGHHLSGLFFNMFEQLWPGLLKKGFLKKLQTPIIRVEQGKAELEFMNLNDFYDWEKQQTKPYEAHYLKGLGSNDTKYFKKYMYDNKYMLDVTYQTAEDKEALSIAFDKARADDRKYYLYEGTKA